MFVDTVFVRIILYTIIGVGLSNEFFFFLLLSRLDPKIAYTFIYMYIVILIYRYREIRTTFLTSVKAR